MTQRHTPGPWYTSNDAVPEWHTQVSVCSEETGERIATVFQSEENALLIAAAPELLSAARDAEAQLWALFEAFESGAGAWSLQDKRAVVALRAAIAKAAPADVGEPVNRNGD